MNLQNYKYYKYEQYVQEDTRVGWAQDKNDHSLH